MMQQEDKQGNNQRNKAQIEFPQFNFWFITLIFFLAYLH